MSSLRTLQLDLGERSYPIHIGSGLLDDRELLRSGIRGRKVCVVTNATIAPHYLDRVVAGLDGIDVATVVLPDGEQHKNLATLNTIFDTLLEQRHDRGTCLLALGGGVVGDMTGFAAACYQRGVDFVQLPTTLLAQVDSSVGGKTGVNHRLGKNMIGAFHQPRAVLIDTDVLATLPPREFAAGVAEVIKYGLINDAPFFEWLESNLGALMARDAAVMAEAIHRSCANKAAVVAEDERESGRRAILNLGHTFGHAIETATGYESWLHGEAVAAGMVMATDLSCRALGLADTVRARLVALLERAGLPVCGPDLAPDRYLELMSHDKKVVDGRLRLVLLEAVGSAVVRADVDTDQIVASIRNCSPQSA